MTMKFVAILKIVLFSLIITNVSQLLMAQPEDLTQIWPAHWIKAAVGPERDFGVFYFRRTVNLEQLPEALIVHTSGDNRYQLFVNGKQVVLGPQRGDLDHWKYESIDIAPFLKAGNNVLAAVVWNYGAYPPDAQMTIQTAFLLAAGDKNYHFLNTNKKWKAIYNGAYAPIPLDKSQVSGYFGAGSTEKLDARLHIWNWDSPDFNDSNWAPAVQIESAKAKTCIWAGRWKLEPRTIATEIQMQQRFESIPLAEGIPKNFLKDPKEIFIPANQTVRLVFDQGVITTAYPELVLSGGQDALIQFKYAEAPYVNDTPKLKDKGNRNVVENKYFLGVYDQYIADGGENRIYTPLWWRTFRYVEMTIKTSDEPLTLHDYRSILTHYPFEQKATLKLEGNFLPVTSDLINKILEVGERTVKLCSHETYMDCPYYEQVQFEGDTRIQALVSYMNFGDPSLAKNAMNQFAWSQNEQGFLSARYPVNSTYYIPNYSIFYIGMLYDYMMYVGGANFVRSHMQTVRSILNYFLERQRPDGTIKRPDYHNFVDWSFPRGECPFSENGYSALVDLHVLLALQWAVKLEDYAGDSYFRDLYHQKSESLQSVIHKIYWDNKAGLYADVPEKDSEYSVHTNCMAIITDVIQGLKARKLMKQVLSSDKLRQPTVYWQFYLFEALDKSGLGNEYLNHLGIWKDMLDAGCTTWPETTLKSRSECHGWGASPNYHFYKIVLGVQPAAPGFEEVLVAPKPGKASFLEGEVPHPKGKIGVRLEKLNQMNPVAYVHLPAGVKGKFYWKENGFPLKSGEQIIRLK